MPDNSPADEPRNSIIKETAEVTYRRQKIFVPRGITVAELMRLHPHPDDDEVLAAMMNNRVVSLAAKVVRSGVIEPVFHSSQHGARIYRHGLTMMLYEVFYTRHPSCRIRVGQAISEGYYFEVEGVKVTAELLAGLRRDLKNLAAAKRPFVFQRVPVEEARRIFAVGGYPVKRQILDTWPSSHVGIVRVGSFVDFCFGPAAPHTGHFSEFELEAVDDDFILRFPDPGNKELLRIEGPQPKLYRTHKEARKWSDLLGISHVGGLNAACIDGSIREVIKVSEGLHEKRISAIADEIAARPDRRLVFIAGPSSAGKTTFTKRLSIQLLVNGKRPLMMSLDNYYVDRESTPRDENGAYDFEALEAVDLPLFNEHLTRLLAGERVASPRYDFAKGTRVPERDFSPMQLGPDQVVIVEGIHGLNDALTPAIPKDRKYRVYVNALNPLAIDDHNRLNTSDTRLIRRIVRDRHYRGYSAGQTIDSWHSVRRGERRHIFPFQESADVMFDTSLIYEFSVLKIFAERYLLEVTRDQPAFAEAYRLRKFLSMFVTVLPGDVPHTSLIREFIGGSSFSY
ncbi:MAG: nucleoside kinase [Deltaproteobacteria bacterium]|nr:nucleoside kinase [Deltaproteobacteria bacterium]